MFAGYFDESGLDAHSKTFWVAGYVQHFRDWPSFSFDWNRALRSRGVAAFHMMDLVGRRANFDGWSDAQAVDLMDELVSIINSSDVLGFGAGLVKDDYERVIARGTFLEEVGLKPEWWRKPYLLAFQQCIVEAVLKATDLPKSEKITFIFDRQAEFAARSKAVFAEMSDEGLWPSGDRLGGVHFESKDDRTPLQAADLLAYELRKFTDDKRSGSGRAMRRSLERLRKRVVACRLAETKHMVRVVDEIRESRRRSLAAGTRNADKDTSSQTQVI